jgi:hypothetical protein
MWVMQREGSSRIVATTLARQYDEAIAPPQGGGFELRKVAGAIHGYAEVRCLVFRFSSPRRGVP